MYKHTVAIVDDEAYVIEELREAFDDEGFAVVTAPNGNDALALPALADIDVLITDLKMPGLDGISLYKALREKPGFRAKAILLSGHGAESNRVEAMKAGFSCCLAKPVDLNALLEIAAQLCTNRTVTDGS